MPHTARRENVVECHDAIAAGEITVGCECDGMLAARSMSLNTLDYIAPSVLLAREHLAACSRADWIPEIEAMMFATWPSAGFHWRLVDLTAAWFRRHPLKPLPMIKL